MGFEQLKSEVAALSDREQAELIRYTLQLRHANNTQYHHEVTERLNDKDKSHWLTPDEFENRLNRI
jgi:asparagine synthetase B (glutamine-hydrolysing)